MSAGTFNYKDCRYESKTVDLYYVEEFNLPYVTIKGNLASEDFKMSQIACFDLIEEKKCTIILFDTSNAMLRVNKFKGFLQDISLPTAQELKITHIYHIFPNDDISKNTVLNYIESRKDDAFTRKSFESKEQLFEYLKNGQI